MRYSIEPRERRYVKGYGFLSFAKNIGRNLINEYGKNLFDTAKNSATDALKIERQKERQQERQKIIDKLRLI